MEEKRKYIRVPLAVKVTNVRTKEFHFFYSKDISMGGMFLETKDPYPVGTEVELDFFSSHQRQQRTVSASWESYEGSALRCQQEGATYSGDGDRVLAN